MLSRNAALLGACLLAASLAIGTAMIAGTSGDEMATGGGTGNPLFIGRLGRPLPGLRSKQAKRNVLNAAVQFNFEFGSAPQGPVDLDDSTKIALVQDLWATIAAFDTSGGLATMLAEPTFVQIRNQWDSQTQAPSSTAYALELEFALFPASGQDMFPGVTDKASLDTFISNLQTGFAALAANPLPSVPSILAGLGVTSAGFEQQRGLHLRFVSKDDPVRPPLATLPFMLKLTFNDQVSQPPSMAVEGLVKRRFVGCMNTKLSSNDLEYSDFNFEGRTRYQDSDSGRQVYIIYGHYQPPTRSVDTAKARLHNFQAKAGECIADLQKDSFGNEGALEMFDAFLGRPELRSVHRFMPLNEWGFPAHVVAFMNRTDFDLIMGNDEIFAMTFNAVASAGQVIQEASSDYTASAPDFTPAQIEFNGASWFPVDPSMPEFGGARFDFFVPFLEDQTPPSENDMSMQTFMDMVTALATYWPRGPTGMPLYAPPAMVPTGMPGPIFFDMDGMDTPKNFVANNIYFKISGAGMTAQTWPAIDVVARSALRGLVANTASDAKGSYSRGADEDEVHNVVRGAGVSLLNDDNGDLYAVVAVEAIIDARVRDAFDTKLASEIGNVASMLPMVLGVSGALDVSVFNGPIGRADDPTTWPTNVRTPALVVAFEVNLAVTDIDVDGTPFIFLSAAHQAAHAVAASVNEVGPDFDAFYFVGAVAQPDDDSKSLVIVEILGVNPSDAPAIALGVNSAFSTGMYAGLLEAGLGAASGDVTADLGCPVCGVTFRKGADAAKAANDEIFELGVRIKGTSNDILRFGGPGRVALALGFLRAFKANTNIPQATRDRVKFGDLYVDFGDGGDDKHSGSGSTSGSGSGSGSNSTVVNRRLNGHEGGDREVKFVIIANDAAEAGAMDQLQQGDLDNAIMLLNNQAMMNMGIDEMESCSQDADCPTGQSCGDDGYCYVPHTGGCSEDSHCPSHWWCDNGQCNGKSCNGAGDCSNGAVCKDNMCHDAMWCNSNNHCGQDQYCDHNQCKNNNNNKQCIAGVFKYHDENNVAWVATDDCAATHGSDCPAATVVNSRKDGTGTDYYLVEKWVDSDLQDC